MASPSGSLAMGTDRICTGRHRSVIIRRTRASCWASFSPNTAASGRVSWSSLSTTVSTPVKNPGRDAPSSRCPAGPGSTVICCGSGYICAGSGVNTSAAPSSAHTARSSASGRG